MPASRLHSSARGLSFAAVWLLFTVAGYSQNSFDLWFSGGMIPKSAPMEDAYGFKFSGLIVTKLDITINPQNYETNGGFEASVSYDIEIEPYINAVGPDGQTVRVDLDGSYEGDWYVTVDCLFEGKKIATEVLTNKSGLGLIIPHKRSNKENMADRLMENWTFQEVVDRLSFQNARFTRYVSAADRSLQTFLSNWASDRRAENKAQGASGTGQKGTSNTTTTGTGSASGSGTHGSTGTSGQSNQQRAQELNDRAIMQYNTGDFDGALKTIDQALAISPGNQTLLDNRKLVVHEINKQAKTQAKLEAVDRATEVVTNIATDMLATPGGQFGFYADSPDGSSMGYGISFGLADRMHLNMGSDFDKVLFVFTMDMFFSDLFLKSPAFTAGVYPTIGIGSVVVYEDPDGIELTQDFTAVRLGIGTLLGDDSFYMKIGVLWNVFEISKSGDFELPSTSFYLGIGIGS